MERIVLKHRTGSKANQVEEFPLSHVKELILGRDPSSTVRYDPDRDDLVGRQHARVAQDPNDPSEFVLTDLNSRNGTFVNGQRVAGTARLNPGDVVTLGPNGPEFVFEVEPRPTNATKPTRVVNTGSMAPTVQGAPATRVAGGVSSSPTPFTPPTQPPPASGVGKATVERMISQNVAQAKKSQGRTYLLVGAAALVAVVVLFSAVGGFLLWRMKSAASSEISGLKQSLDAAKAGEPMKPNDVVKNYGGAVVKIDVVWKLVSSQGNGLVYHQYLSIGGSPRACYVRLPDGKIEPYLTYNSNQLSVAIGGAHSGSGFAVSSDGFILTNRHVAAAWETVYDFPPSANNGVLLGPGQDGRLTVLSVVEQAPNDWVPARSKQDGISYDGRNDRLDVTFPKSDRRLSAKLSAVSPRHDVSMIKVDSPGTVPKVELNDNYDTIQPGDSAIVLGYPGVSPPVLGIVKSQDLFNREAQLTEIPDPTVTVTNIGRVLRGKEDLNEKTITYSQFGDVYQLSTNTTGAGNSGGPVFDDQGRVVGIFYAGRSAASASVTFAVPIKYGRELMGVK